MKLYSTLFLMAAFCMVATAQTAQWQWAKSGRGLGHDYGHAIGVDGRGSCYVTGYYQAPFIIFGNDTLNNSNTGYQHQFYLVKYDSTGYVMWAKQGGGENGAYGTSISTDVHGYSYVSGYFQGSGVMQIGTYTLTASRPGFGEGFIIKYDSAGNVVWAQITGSTFSDEARIINAIDTAGNVYVTGHLDSGSVLIKKFDADGNLLWHRTPTGRYHSTDIYTDAAGNSYVTGAFSSATLVIENDTIENTGANSQILFIAKYDTDGNLLWAKSDGGSSIYQPRISCDAAGNAYLTGYYVGANGAQFGNIQLINPDAYEDIFIVKYDTAANLVWAKRAGGNHFDEGHAIATDAQGNSYITGFFRNAIQFGTSFLVSAGGTDVFVAKYDNNGNVLWVNQASSPEAEGGNDIAIDENGNCYITGQWISPVLNFGSSPISNFSQSTEMFVAKVRGVTGTTGITTMGQNVFGIYPNPANNYLHIQNSGIQVNEVAIYSIAGALMSRYMQPAGNVIDISALPAGMYIAEITGKDETTKLKWIKM